MTLLVLVLAMVVVTLLALYRRHRDNEYIEIDDADIWAVMPPPPPHRRAA
jgi:hypothetical protein